MFTCLKFLLAILLLYVFILSLSFLSIGFTLVASRVAIASEVIKYVLSNPFAALAIGIIVTAVMQNGTATSSIVLILVGVGIIPNVKMAIPIIYGSNIGTCVTNSLIALTLANDPNEFKRAFSAATLNDGFNILTTCVLLFLEIIFGQKGFLSLLTEKIVDSLPLNDPEALAKINFLSVIVTPVTDAFILLNNTAVDLMSSGNTHIQEVSLKCCQLETYRVLNMSQSSDMSHYVNQTRCVKNCHTLCMPMLRRFGDSGTGLILIILSIVGLLVSLFAIVKVFSAIIIGPIAKLVTQALNNSFPGKFKWLTQVALFLTSMLLTIIVQSSNIVTATLVPLCAMGIISLQKVYVMTLGSNIGTTVTGILTAFTCPPSSLKKSMQLAFVYTFFNLLGVIFWLPVPTLRLPKLYATKLGNTVFEYRWFLYVYISSVYFIVPFIVFLLALIPHWIGLSLFGVPLIGLLISYLVVLFLRSKYPNALPSYLIKFDWLPYWLRSLKPLDNKMKSLKCNCCNKSQRKIQPTLTNQQVVSIIVDKFVVADSPENILEANNEPGFIPLMIRHSMVLNGLISEAQKVSPHESSIDEDLSGKSREHHLSRKLSVNRSEIRDKNDLTHM